MRPAGSAAEACGRAAAQHLRSSALLARARRVALFASLADEIPTRPVFDLLHDLGRSALLPRIVRGDGLVFAGLARWEDLRPGPFGVGEPRADAPRVELGPGDLVLVPGLGFDRRGRRLGRGGGHYDRTFPPGAAAPALLGLAFACQLVDEIPSGAHDRWMDGIVTEQGVLHAARREGGR